MTTMVFEIITDTGQTILDRSRAELTYQNAYAVITEKVRAASCYVVEQSGASRRFLQIRENGSIVVIDALPLIPSDAISPPPTIPSAAPPRQESPKSKLAGGMLGKLKPSTTSRPKTASVTTAAPAQKVRVKVKVPQAVLYGSVSGALLIGYAAGFVTRIMFF